MRFCLDTCVVLKRHAEYVGPDIMKDDSTPTQSKFNMIKDWELPEIGQLTQYFIGPINLYLRYASYFEIRLK